MHRKRRRSITIGRSAQSSECKSSNAYAVARDVKKHGAILFCRLTDEYSPMSRIILSQDRAQTEGLPFGSIPLIRVTPITEVEIEGQDQSDDWAANAAKYALAKRQIGI